MNPVKLRTAGPGVLMEKAQPITLRHREMSSRFYRLQQKLGITRQEAAAVSILMMLFLIGAGVRGWSHMFADVPAYDYATVDSVFTESTRQLYAHLAADPPSTSEISTSKTAPAPAGLININTAGATELQRLPRIGPAIAGRIMEYRASRGGFRKIDDLMNVAGIGPRTLDQLRPLVTVAEADSAR